ncbi:UNVERIFIED_CONTAM: hypothetical protein K2H54_030215 [Gekko kuhli]
MSLARATSLAVAVGLGTRLQLSPVKQEVKQRFAAEKRSTREGLNLCFKPGLQTFLPAEQDVAFHHPSTTDFPAAVLQRPLETPVPKPKSLRRCNSSPCELPLGVVRARSKAK